MKLVAPFNHIVIDLNLDERKLLDDLMKRQEDLKDLDKSLGYKFDTKKICNIPWKKLKYIVMKGDRSREKIKFFLNDHE